MKLCILKSESVEELLCCGDKHEHGLLQRLPAMGSFSKLVILFEPLFIAFK